MKLYTLISLGILASFGLSGCSEDKIVNTNLGIEEPELKDYTIKGKINDESGIGLTWAAGDGFTLWNRNYGKAYAFNISENYNAGNPSAEADFGGKAAIKDEHLLLAVSPQKEVKVLSDLIEISMPDTCKVSEFSKYAFLTAAASVKDNEIPELSFSPKTARLNFRLNNVSDTELKVAYITLESLTDVFPLNMNLTGEGEIGEIYNAAKSVTIDMESQTIPAGGSIDGNINIIPTSNGSSSFMKQSTALNVKVKLLQNDQPFDYTAWTGTVGELPLEGDINMIETSYQFYTGMNYPINVNVNNFSIPEEGYSVDEEGNITIYNEDGLKAWGSNYTAYKNVTIDKRFIENNTIEYPDKWVTVDQFNYTFNGNGVILKNVSGFINKNTGTIKNIILEDNQLTSVASGNNAIFVNNNSGSIINCHIQGNSTMTLSGTDGNSGMLVGTNESDGTIYGCSVSSANMTVSAKQNAGLIAGINNGKIINCSVSAGTITYSGNSNSANIGGITGSNSGIITAVSSSVTINLNKAANAGGIAGSANGGQIGISYAIPVINNTESAGTVYGLIGASAGNGVSVISCYSWANGLGLAPNSITECTESYYLGTKDGSAGTGLSNTAELQGKANDMNLQVTGSGYRYINGTDAEPLVITSNDEGTEGPDLGEGGEI